MDDFLQKANDYGRKLVNVRIVEGKERFSANWFALNRHARFLLSLFRRDFMRSYGFLDENGVEKGSSWRNSKSFRQCGLYLLPGQTSIRVTQPASGQPYRISKNLKRCGSRTCPSCGLVLSASDCDELGKAFVEWRKGEESNGLNKSRQIVMTTLTFSHKRNDKLSDLMTISSKIRNNFNSNKKVKAIREEFGMMAYHYNVETPYGDNGFHVHCHYSEFSSLYLTARQAFQYEKALLPIYQTVCKNQHVEANSHAVRVQICKGGTPEYVNKQAMELTLGNFTKDGEGHSHLKTPNQILLESMVLYFKIKQAGGFDAVPPEEVFYWASLSRVWVEWKEVMTGKVFSTWDKKNAKKLFPFIIDESDGGDDAKMEKELSRGLAVLDVINGPALLGLSDDDKYSLCSFGYDDDVNGLRSWLGSRGFDFRDCFDSPEMGLKAED
jgi:hypothetical protein